MKQISNNDYRVLTSKLPLILAALETSPDNLKLLNAARQLKQFCLKHPEKQWKKIVKNSVQ
jgi:hypothetical protein